MKLCEHWHCPRCGGANAQKPKTTHPCTYCGYDGTSATADDVRALRELTGCGLMECKRALDETYGNMDASVELLRTRGLA